MKKSWRTFPLLAILAVGIVGTGSPVHKASAFAGGAGTSVNPYQISSCSELLEIDDTVANLSAHYILSGNIDCTSIAITPMKNGSTYFSGTFNGDSKNISGLAINCSTDDCGLFARINGATFRDVEFIAPAVTTSAKYVGVIAGRASNAILIDNVTFNGGSVTNTYSLSNTNHEDFSYTGGLVGYYSTSSAVNGTITNIETSMVVSGKSRTGGIVAEARSSATLTISDVVVSGNVSGLSWVGGVLAHGQDQASGAVNNGVTIRRAQVTAASVSGLGQSIGGILGFGWNVTIDDSFSSADVSGRATGLSVGISVSTGRGAYIGGIAGQISGGDSTIRDTGSTGDVIAAGTDDSVSIGDNLITASGAAGIIGYARLTNLYLTRVFHVGDVTGVERVGGLVGIQSSSVVIVDSYSRSNLLGINSSRNYGGMIGEVSNSASITRSYFAGTQNQITATARYSVTKTDSASRVTCTGFYFDETLLGSNKTSSTANRCGGNGGVASKATADMKTVGTFTASSWNFTSGSAVWTINPTVNDGYPFHSSAGVDISAPTLASGAVSANGSTVVLTFSEALHATTAPASAFTVTASLVNVTPTSVIVNGSTLTLTLPSVIAPNVNVTVAYVAPASNSATSNSAVQDLFGNDAASFSNRSVTNNSTADVVAPTVSWAEPSSPSSSRTLSYTLTFSEPVSGISSGDFSFNGTASGCVTTPLASTANVSVIVSVTCSSDGTVIMRLAPNSVLDAASNTGPTSAVLASSVTINTTTPTTAPTGTVAPTQATVPSSGTTLPSVGTGTPSAPAPAPVAQGVGTTVAPTTTLPSPSTTTTTLPSVDVPEVADGGGALVVNGERIEATITRENNQLVIAAGELRARISAVQREGGRAPLDSQGRIRMDQGDSIEIEVTGFGTESEVEVRMYSDPVLLGRSTVSALGSLAASYEVPESVDDGRHTVVLLGESQQGEELTFALAVFIGAESTGPSTLALLVGIPLGLAVVAALVIPAIIRRRRTDVEVK